MGRKNPIIGVLLGTGFVIIGILSIMFPELGGFLTPRGITITRIFGLAYLSLGLSAILYYSSAAYIKYRKKQ